MPLTTAPSLVIMSLGSPEVNALMNMRNTMNMMMVFMQMLMFDHFAWISPLIQNSNLNLFSYYKQCNDLFISKNSQAPLWGFCACCKSAYQPACSKPPPPAGLQLFRIGRDSNVKNYIYSKWEDWLSEEEGRSIVWPKAPNFMRA